MGRKGSGYGLFSGWALQRMRLSLQETSSATVFWLAAWYFCSLVTLFMNKTILSTMGGDQYVLGITQMSMTATLGAIKVYAMGRSRRGGGGGGGSGGGSGGGILNGNMSSNGKDINSNNNNNSNNISSSSSSNNGGLFRPHYDTFWRDMIYVGIMRGLTVILGLVSLAHVAVSFTETVKSSSPFFTVLFAYLMLGTKTSWQVNVSLLPVMFGLALCSATELSFDTIGFFAAVGNNVIDCVQNVFSKKLLQSLSPVELQFYTSAAAAILQLPMLIYIVLPQIAEGVSDSLSPTMVFYLLVDSVFYHLQSVTAYYTMSLLTPVSQSVANTVKRALLIFLSIIYFGNPVTLWNVLGMMIVSGGVFLYNHCRLEYPGAPLVKQ